uniref:Dolichyl-diphosphooligosaccharide--protein glycosyltransferase subunit 2 n=1 Tax=Rhabditophanes sp. KR3021 TaxID=114890 RepID=A0AC35U1P3_9BILA
MRVPLITSFLLLAACLVHGATKAEATTQQPKTTPPPSKPTTYEVKVDKLRVNVYNAKEHDVMDLTAIKDNGKLSDVLVANDKKKLIVKFNVKEVAGNKPVTVQQAFITLIHKETGHQVNFIAGQVKGQTEYSVEVLIAKFTEQFNGVGGLYEAFVVVGDTQASNGIRFNAFDIKITPPSLPFKPARKSLEVNYEVQKEFTHLFQEPEKRPNNLYADTFTVLCLAPFLLMFVLWIKIGINFRATPCTIWALLFPLSLTAIMGLYTVFWFSLNMFDCLKYLTLIGSFAFFVGNRLLTNLADQRLKKE